MKILFATDGSEYNKAVVEEFADMQFISNAEVLIVSAFESSTFIMSTAAPMGGLAGYYEEVDSAARKAAEDAVEKAAVFLRDKKLSLSITTAVDNGSPKHIILKEAEKFNANLIVVGSHGHGAIESFLLGSVSQSVSLHAACSVLIVRKRDSKNKKEKNTQP